MSAYGRKQTFGLSLNRYSLTAALGEKAAIHVALTPAPAADAGRTLVQKNDEIAVQGGFRGTFRDDTYIS
jgi:hypothetical protein